MKKKLVKCVGFTSVVMMAMGCMAGCGNTSQSNAAAVSNLQEEKNLSVTRGIPENLKKHMKMWRKDAKHSSNGCVPEMKYRQLQN